MKVSIWDLDYYYAKNKVNCFNPDVMKIASYHEQLGDVINFVVKEDDIHRPYDLYYIIREKMKTPAAPTSFYFKSKIRWWGKAYKARINWHMSDAMLACRPDYLLYPERNTKLERSEQIRLFNNNAELLPITQDWTNTFKNKYAIVTDPCMWFADKKSIIIALKTLEEVKKVSFLEPIWIQKIIYDKDIEEEFLKLKFSPGSNIEWTKVNMEQTDDFIAFVKRFKTAFPRVKVGPLKINYKDKKSSHWENKEDALKDLRNLQDLIIKCKNNNIQLNIQMPIERLETPYFFIFEELSNWVKYNFTYSWLEYLSERFDHIKPTNMVNYWNHPEQWHECFRDLLRQTYKNTKFLLLKWNNNYISENDIPWKIWDKEFINGI